MPPCRFTSPALLTAIAVSGSILLCRAEPVTFTVDPARSSISLGGAVVGNTISEQAPGSLTTQYDGTLAADLTDSNITFTGTGTLNAKDSGTWSPAANGEPGSAPASYGAKATSFLANATAAARNVQFTATSSPLPIANGSFDSAQIVFRFPDAGNSVLDYAVTGLLSDKDRIQLSGLATNEVTTTSTLVTSGDTQTLTIPIRATYFLTLLTPGDVRLTVTGQVVAVRNPGGGGGGATLEDYITEKFPGVTDPAIIGPAADPDGDGLPNFVEFAFGLTPTTADAGFSPLDAQLDTSDPSRKRLEFVRPKGLSGVTYSLEVSANLTTWSPLAATPEITDLGNGQERVVFIDTEPLSASTPRLIRLKISHP